MPRTLKQIIDKAVELAEGVGGQPVRFDEAAAELLLPQVWNNVLIEAGRTPGKLKGIRETGKVTFAGGVAPLPSGVMPEFYETSQLYGVVAATNAPDPNVSYIPHYVDLLRPLSIKFGAYAIKDGEIHARWLPGTGVELPDGEFDFEAVTAPAIPTTAAGTLNAPDDLIDDLEIALAKALRGDPPFQRLGDEERS